MKLKILFLWINIIINHLELDLKILKTNNLKLNFKCFNKLMKNYNFEGINDSIDSNIKICPNVKNTCCSNSDTKKMQSNWSNLKSSLESHYNSFILINKYILGYNDEIYLLAKRIEKETKNNVCKKSSKKIIGLNITSKLINEINNSFYNQIVNIKKIRQGTYCILCDANTHYIFLKNNKFNDGNSIIYYDKKFCNNLINKTIDGIYNYNIYIQPYINNLINLIDCELNKINIEKPVKNVWENELIKNCYENQDKDYFFYCEKICEDFKLDIFSDYFDGNIKNLRETYKMIKIFKDKIFQNSNNNILINAEKTEKKIDLYLNNLEKSNDLIFLKPIKNSKYNFNKFDVNYVNNEGYNPNDSIENNFKDIYIDSNTNIIIFKFFIILIYLLD